MPQGRWAMGGLRVRLRGSQDDAFSTVPYIKGPRGKSSR